MGTGGAPRWNYHPKENRKRVLKTQGNCKVGEDCTAYMKTTKCATDGTVSVDYCTTHAHDIAIGHLRITDDVRVSIATKLAHGVHIDNILDYVRDEVDKTLGREHLISKQDIHNIQKQFCVEGVQ